jgi:hypothetical protein
MVAEKLLKDEYKTPRAFVRGVFLCEDVAVPVSVLTWEIEQEAWAETYTTVGTSVSDAEDIWIEL